MFWLIEDLFADESGEKFRSYVEPTGCKLSKKDSILIYQQKFLYSNCAFDWLLICPLLIFDWSF